ncbi:MAG: sugar ABC transporter ATP-binding protein [Flavobacteriaceae bacterium]|nr:sugar ABC transporter ATP-binding protein [Flavobacteriaceae bacterium]
MNFLEFKNINKSFSGVEVLHDISFSLEKGKVFALIGENGAGKSTLMKILCGILTDYQGNLFLKNKNINFKNTREAEHAGIAIIHQELNLVDELTVAENIFLGREPVNKLGFVDFNKMREETKKLLIEFDFPYTIDTKVSQISIGWQQMIEISKALYVNSEIIVMDEPTSALSEMEIEFLFKQIEKLKKKGKTIIYISHRMKEIFEIADETIILRDGYFIGKYKIDDINQSFLVNKMAGKELVVKSIGNKLSNAKTMLKLDKVSIYHNKNQILSKISFDLKVGEVIGVAGLLGAGRTELLKFLYGVFGSNFDGNLEFNNKLYTPKSSIKSIKNKIVYLSEDRKNEGIFPELSNLKNSSISILPGLSKFGFIKNKEEKIKVLAKTKELNVKMHTIYQHIQKLSGGNQQKVLLSRALLIHPKLLLLDEPTRGIDVGAKQEFYNLISKLKMEGMGIILTSSELPELLLVSDRILVLSQGRQTALLETSKTTSKEILNYAFKETVA